ncbi:hypothetical protein BHM03_00004564 [Ensete ventricosum]|nr:hypothetical protein BHM03_00004564 [Ensete ventricosum]
MNSRASHYNTFDLQNLSIHNNYEGNEDIIIGDGKGIPITHIGSTTLKSHTTSFTLDDVQCAPHIKRNFIFISQLCKQNYTFIELFPNNFLVKNLSTRVSLVRGQNKDNIYEWSSALHLTQPTANSSTTALVDVWHQRLNQPSPSIQQKLPFSLLYFYF